MPAFSPALADHLRTHRGVVADHQLRNLGVTRHQREALVRDGLLIPMHRGVYIARSAPLTLEARCLGISLADARAVVTGSAAAALWAVRRGGRPDSIDVRVPHGANTLDVPGIRLRRCNVMDPVDVVELEDGTRVVSPPRLAFDLADVISDVDLESVIEQLLDRQWCTMRTLHETAHRLCHAARPGSARFARVLWSRPAWLKPADSHLEVRLHDALRRAGVSGLVRQHRIELPAGWAIHADLAVPEIRWAIAVDHVTWHGGRIEAQRDKQNDRQARMLGWQVDRVTDEDISLRLSETVRELLAIHARLTSSVRLDRRHAG